MTWEGRAPLSSHSRLQHNPWKAGAGLPALSTPALAMEPGEQESGMKEAMQMPLRVAGHAMQGPAEASEQLKSQSREIPNPQKRV